MEGTHRITGGPSKVQKDATANESSAEARQPVTEVHVGSVPPLGVGNPRR